MDADMTPSSARPLLADEIAAAKLRAEGSSFVTGVDDCGLWIADIYRAVLGVDPMEPYRGRYSNAEEAATLFGPSGVEGAAIKTARRMGWPTIDPAQADIGDLGLIKPLSEYCLAIFDGQFWIGRLDGGYSAHDTAVVKRAWSVAR